MRETWRLQVAALLSRPAGAAVQMFQASDGAAGALLRTLNARPHQRRALLGLRKLYLLNLGSLVARRERLMKELQVCVARLPRRGAEPRTAAEIAVTRLPEVLGAAQMFGGNPLQPAQPVLRQLLRPL